jgi:hypothetical protein
MRLTLRTPRHWRRSRRTLAALAITGLVLVLVDYLTVGIAVFGVGLLGLVLLESAQLRHAMVESDRQQYALTQIRPLVGDVPVDFAGWSADPILVHNAVRLVTDTRPALILECGSGSSTVAIARCLRAMGHGRIVALEHDPVYAQRTRDLLRLHGVEDVGTVVLAPLVPRVVHGRSLRWYSPTYEALLDQKVDVLLVDGPPGASAPRARYPAVPILESYLAARCSILLDDGDRQDERQAAQAWSRELGAALSYLEGGRGGWLLHRSPASTTTRRTEP